MATSGCPGGPDREPAEVAHLGHGDVAAHLEADLLGPVLQGLVLVVHPQLGGGDADHAGAPRLSRVVALVCGLDPVHRDRAARRLLETCAPAAGCRPAPRRPAPGPPRRPGVGGAVGRGRHPEHPPEAHRERADAAQPHRHADPATDQSVERSSDAARSSRRVSRYWCGRLPEGAAELAAEVGGGEPRGRGEVGDGQRVGVAPVGEVLGAQQVAAGRAPASAESGTRPASLGWRHEQPPARPPAASSSPAPRAGSGAAVAQGVRRAWRPRRGAPPLTRQPSSGPRPCAPGCPVTVTSCSLRTSPTRMPCASSPTTPPPRWAGSTCS